MMNQCRCGQMNPHQDQKAYIFQLCNHCGRVHINAQLFNHEKRFQKEQQKFQNLTHQALQARGCV